ncbi:methyl-accepting chemotaxis protein [Hirschia baltica]|uniref:Methyl-accepting chemotaxis sensory transducer with Pas/Pac sensor n=1 Tax=Hirschia baltica (strain ATCC 49814 / DSM 5838 / IFAM 1418) TaxID=582402 RepID=C6XM18_HIRBI|nr:methyl-accepting chemotaxis protein [Hirschia baltica]ACT59850.1 methyl-accepting chemotaxis sensory transducer with Pas/Pac sensor [Hirschia baltica ATCC 49814]
MNSNSPITMKTAPKDTKSQLMSSAAMFVGGAAGLAGISLVSQQFGLMPALILCVPVAAVAAGVGFMRKGSQLNTHSQLRELSAKQNAIDKVQAVIEFELDGTILDANQNFCDTVGYRKEEIIGQHHSIFVEREVADGSEYKNFWQKLKQGEFIADEFRRVGKNGKEIWIVASYNPIFDENGRAYKVIKYATDITAEKLKSADMTAQINAINQSQAVIEFDTTGKILNANENFCNTMGYSLSEIKGKHHSMFADPEFARSHEYKQFWEKLCRGEFDSGEYERVAAGGRKVLLQASYNPVFDLNGKLAKVVKYASDLTQSERMKENARIRSALDVATTNVMIADTDFNIVYLNDAQHEMMRVAEDDLKAELSQFDSQKLLGANIDIFHKNPTHQRTMLARLTSTYETDIRVGPRYFHLIATPVFGEDKERVGTVVEWRDDTIEKAIEREVQDVVEAVSRGDFSKSISIEGKDGFMLLLAESINVLSGRVSIVLDSLGMMLDAMSQGDLTKRIEDDFEGVYGKLKEDANATSARLQETVLAISNSATEVSSGAEEISMGATDLSQRTEQQAANLEETASSMQQMAATIKQNADNSQHASQLAVTARESAVSGGEIVHNAVESMSKIEQSSRSISDIIGVIDEIAFQTNLLALNAAVEAARAGDAGRGFAVVASEVRSLAQRSAQAAKDIKDLIVESSSQVKGGVDLVNQTGEALNGIVDAIKKVADIVAEISAASGEQATGAEEINKAITQMDEMTQQNSALVEENAAAAKTMTDQALDMRERMGFFNVGENTIKPKIVGGSFTGKPTPVQSSNRGGARVLQSALAESIQEDDDWSEF